MLQTLTRTEAEYVLPNEPELIPPLVSHLRDNVFRMSGSDETGLIQMTVALREALVNAMEHGNLELDSALRENDDSSYHRLARERRSQPKYAQRRVHVRARESKDEAVYVIRDEGPGFDTSAPPRPNRPGEPGEMQWSRDATDSGIHVGSATQPARQRDHDGLAAE